MNASSWCQAPESRSTSFGNDPSSIAQQPGRQKDGSLLFIQHYHPETRPNQSTVRYMVSSSGCPGHRDTDRDWPDCWAVLASFRPYNSSASRWQSADEETYCGCKLRLGIYIACCKEELLSRPPSVRRVIRVHEFGDPIGYRHLTPVAPAHYSILFLRRTEKCVNRRGGGEPDKADWRLEHSQTQAFGSARQPKQPTIWMY